MKVRVIAGIRELDISDPLCGAWFEFVSFPMKVTNYAATAPADPEELTLNDEEGLRAWAKIAFEPDGYEIWDMELPAGAALDPKDQKQIRRHELAEALTALSTAYDDPRQMVVGVLEEARAVIRAAWKGDDVSVDDLALVSEKLHVLIQAAKQQRP